MFVRRTRLGLGPLALLLVAGGVTGQEAPQLTEVQRLRAQLHQTQEQLLQAQYQLATCTAQAQAVKLAEGRRQLERDLTPTGFVLDWQTLTLTPVKPPAP